MRSGVLVLLLALAMTIVVFIRSRQPLEAQPPNHKLIKPSASVDVSPVCPWRDPPHDLLLLFPPATNYVLDTRIVSRATAAIVKQLGRQMTPDENPLRIHRVQHDGKTIGSVL